MFDQISSTVNTSIPGGLQTQYGFPNPQQMLGGGSGNMLPINMEFQIAGGSIGKGLGWLALVLGLTAALLPYMGRTMDLHTQRLIRFLALGGGATIIPTNFNGTPPTFGQGGNDGAFVGRHLGGGNFLFLDGHVKWLRLEKLAAIGNTGKYQVLSRTLD
ncbi:hypothetical protein EON80_17440 [bacterium]|nr:MAG: hypothetical protein EON80_17440 [bacterium]